LRPTRGKMQGLVYFPHHYGHHNRSGGTRPCASGGALTPVGTYATVTSGWRRRHLWGRFSRHFGLYPGRSRLAVTGAARRPRLRTCLSYLWRCTRNDPWPCKGMVKARHDGDAGQTSTGTASHTPPTWTALHISHQIKSHQPKRTAATPPTVTWQPQRSHVVATGPAWDLCHIANARDRDRSRPCPTDRPSSTHIG
jgi:hypothetical protein